MKKIGRIIETDHNPLTLEIMLDFSSFKPERIEIFLFKNKDSQMKFKNLTSNTNEFTRCFEDDSPFETQAAKWRKLLNSFFHKSFKKVRITNKPKKKHSNISILLSKRSHLKKKDELNEKEEEEIVTLERLIAEQCEEENRKKVVDNFKDLDGNNGNLNHQGVWKAKKKYFPKIKPTLPVGKKNLMNQIITNPEELKNLYLDTFQFRLRHRPVKPGYEDLLELQEELFNLRLQLAKEVKTSPWKMVDLEGALKDLKNGKCRDPEGLIGELFK